MNGWKFVRKDMRRESGCNGTDQSRLEEPLVVTTG